MLSAIRHLDYVVLLCQDLESMKVFYRDTLQFPVHLETDSWVEFRIGASLLTVSKRARPNVGEAPPDGAACVQLAFRVAPDQVNSCWEELVAKGVEIVQPPKLIDPRVRKFWKHKTLFFKDPEGNLLEIYAEVEIDDEES